ncbi:MAG: glycosyltransferase family 4 protein [Fimbriiglobus sp.]
MTRPLTIAVDGRVIFDEVRRGIAKTTIAQYRALAAIRPSWQFHLFYPEGRNDNPFEGLPNIHPRRVSMKGDRYRLWERLRLPWEVTRLRADLFHAISGLSPWWPGAPVLTTINDLIPMESGDLDADGVRWAKNVRRTAQRAKAILTPTAYSRGRIVELCQVPEAKVRVIPWASILAEPDPSHTPETLPRYGLKPGQFYALHFGMSDPRKNTALLLEAWAKLPKHLQEMATLVVVGLSDSGLGQFKQQSQTLGLDITSDSGTVRLFGYAPEQDVRSLLDNAGLLLYPTRYEGFGLPILDGFAAGVPVLTGNSTSLPEVAGDAALLVDVTQVESLTDGLSRMLSSQELRAEFCRRGEKRNSLFTWERTAIATAEVMEWMCGQPRPA